MAPDHECTLTPDVHWQLPARFTALTWLKVPGRRRGRKGCGNAEILWISLGSREPYFRPVGQPLGRKFGSSGIPFPTHFRQRFRYHHFS